MEFVSRRPGSQEMLSVGLVHEIRRSRERTVLLPKLTVRSRSRPVPPYVTGLFYAPLVRVCCLYCVSRWVIPVPAPER